MQRNLLFFLVILLLISVSFADDTADSNTTTPNTTTPNTTTPTFVPNPDVKEGDEIKKIEPETFCGNIFYKDGTQIAIFQNKALEICNKVLNDTKLNSTEGCVKCNIRTINGQYPYEEKIDLSSFCVSKSTSCKRVYQPTVKTLFTKFFEQINTADKFKKLLTNQTTTVPEFKNTTLENVDLPKDSDIQVKLIRHNKDSFTYEISSKVAFPLQCYKEVAREDETPVFEQGGLYFILKPNTSKKIVTEYLPTGNYDCKKYSLYARCYPIPLQYTVTKFTKYDKLITLDHTKAGETCEFEELPYEVPDKPKVEKNDTIKEEMPTLNTEDPKDQFDFSEEIDNISSSETKQDLISALDKTKDSIASDVGSSESYSEKLSQVFKVNDIIGEVSCGEEDLEDDSITLSKTDLEAIEKCKGKKTEMQKEVWNQISNVINKGDIMGNLGSGTENLEINIKITLEIIIVTSNNNEYVDSSTSKKVLETTGNVLKSSNQLIQEIESSSSQNKDELIEDLINLMSSAASSSIQLSQRESKGLIDRNSDIKSMYVGLKNLAKVYIKYGKTEKEMMFYTFNYIPTTEETQPSSRRRVLQDEEENEDENEEVINKPNLTLEGYSVYSFASEKLEVAIPSEYIKEKYFNKEDQIGIAVFTYKTYPFLTKKGTTKFTNYAVSVNLIKNTTTSVYSIDIKNLPEANTVRLAYRNTSEVADFKNCYLFNPEKEKYPSFNSIEREKEVTGEYNEDYIVCNAKAFGDYLIGNYHPGLSPVIIFYIVIVIFDFICYVLFFLFVYNKYKSNEEVDVVNTNLDFENQKPKEKGTLEVKAVSGATIRSEFSSEMGFGSDNLSSPKKIRVESNQNKFENISLNKPKKNNRK